MDYTHDFKNPEICRPLVDRLSRTLDGTSLRFMEVCGTHTVAIFQSGLRDLLPTNITHLSGPGCPVCVTHDAVVAAFLELAGRDGVIVVTFGDLLRVPWQQGKTPMYDQTPGERGEGVVSRLAVLSLTEK